MLILYISHLVESEESNLLLQWSFVKMDEGISDTFIKVVTKCYCILQINTDLSMAMAHRLRIEAVQQRTSAVSQNLQVTDPNTH